MKYILKRILPSDFKIYLKNNKLFTSIYILFESLHDGFNYIRYSASGVTPSKKSKEMLEAEMIFYYHKIEKGMSMPNPRPKFGVKSIDHLVKILQIYIEEFGVTETAEITFKCLNEYVSFNEKFEVDLGVLKTEIDKLNQLNWNNKIIAGAKEIKKTEILGIDKNFENLALSRYSLRDFTDETIGIDLIEKAVEIAQKTPSVCNRQSSRVYLYEDKKNIKELLKHQNGNKGFGHLANKLLIITTRLDHFVGPSERNQYLIDGGMYSMSILYALHSLGIGSCPLNLALDNSSASKLKKDAGINDGEALLMMIAIGGIPEKTKVAVSNRRDVNEVLTVI